MAVRLSAKVRERVETRRAANAKWHEFLEWIRSHQSPRWVFRGQSQRRPLRPTVGRNLQRYLPESEAKLLSEFRRLARPYLSTSIPMTSWDWIFIAQHHGLPTRLLDWTVNPLVAAFFAAQPSPRSKRDGEIVAVEARATGFIDMNLEVDPLSINTVKFVYPSAVASRISAQRGLFSVHPEPTKPWRLRNQTDVFVVPSKLKPDFLRSLLALGIDTHLLMADLDGLTSTLKWKFELGIAFE